jgi:16S rRNA (guanine527-N7)-methyltransferase
MINPAGMAFESQKQFVFERLGVSRETFSKLDLFVEELRRWQAIKNLVGPATLQDVWTRHILDSVQLLKAAPHARIWLDLGSGAGFPGLVLAIFLGDEPGAKVHLVESNARKAAFLQHIVRLTACSAEVHVARLEEFIPHHVGAVDAVCARALAPLVDLIKWTTPLLRRGAVGVFPKGQGVEGELNEAGKIYKFDYDLLVSQVNDRSYIVRVNGFSEDNSRDKP